MNIEEWNGTAWGGKERRGEERRGENQRGLDRKDKIRGMMKRQGGVESVNEGSDCSTDKKEVQNKILVMEGERK